MNICCLEDSGSVLRIREAFADIKDHTFKTTADFRDLAEWITFNPDYYDILILDLILPPRSLYFVPECEEYDEEKHHSPTLYFIERFLLVRFPQFEKKIILFSAFFDDLRSRGCGNQMERFVKVSKHGSKSVDNLIINIDTLYKQSINYKN